VLPLDVPSPDKDVETDMDGFPLFIDPITKGQIVHARHLRTAMAGRVPLNPTSDFWRELLRSGFPFIKREMLRDNPTFVGDVMDWQGVVRQETGAEVDPIERDLKRVMRERAP